MKIITARRIETVVEYSLFIHYKGKDIGFMFDCDEAGKVSPSTRFNQNYQECMAKPWLYEKPYVEKHERDIKHSAIGECGCGRRVALSSFTNSCECGFDYNSAGQKLSPRSQWGEETGESLVDILRIQ